MQGVLTGGRAAGSAIALAFVFAACCTDFWRTLDARKSWTQAGPQPFYTSLETDGTHWSPYNQQTFEDGSGWMAADRPGRVVYAALWDQGLWRLATGH